LPCRIPACLLREPGPSRVARLFDQEFASILAERQRGSRFQTTSVKVWQSVPLRCPPPGQLPSHLPPCTHSARYSGILTHWRSPAPREARCQVQRLVMPLHRDSDLPASRSRGLEVRNPTLRLGFTTISESPRRSSAISGRRSRSGPSPCHASSSCFSHLHTKPSSGSTTSLTN
jgi:hypothetical protein